MNIFDNYNTSIGKESYTDNYELKISKNMVESKDDVDSDIFDIYDIGDDENNDVVIDVKRKPKKKKAPSIKVKSDEKGYKKSKIKTDQYRKAYYRLNKNSFRYDKYIKDWMEENRKTVDYTPIKNDEIKKLIFKLKKGNEKKEDNMYFLMEKKKKRNDEKRVDELLKGEGGKLKGRDWLYYITESIPDEMFENYKIVKKFIEYYDKYNLEKIDGEVVGLKIKDRPVMTGINFFISEWKKMFNTNTNEEKEKFLENSKEFIEHNNNK